MSYAQVCEAVTSLKNKHIEKDPFRLCNEMGILLIPQSLGTDEDAIKGYYLESNRIKSITVNADLPVVIQKIIVAHELGHDYVSIGVFLSLTVRWWQKVSAVGNNKCKNSAKYGMRY